jgi:hypothetical protein
VHVGVLAQVDGREVEAEHRAARRSRRRRPRRSGAEPLAGERSWMVEVAHELGGVGVGVGVATAWRSAACWPSERAVAARRA